ncbi:MAG: hypothetical protein SGPRY_014441, partial [Prymnesium sp.]
NARLIPVPHIAATREPSAASLEEKLAKWQQSFGNRLSEALIVRGDPKAGHQLDLTPSSPSSASASSSPAFSSSLELLESGVLKRGGLQTLCFCGHPEGTGGSSMEASLPSLANKLAWAEENDLQARVVTQFTFYSGVATGFLEAMRAGGMSAPVSLGVVGPSSLPLRKGMAERCGVAPPASPYVTPFMRRIASWQSAQPEGAGLQSIHLYPFGGAGSTLKWLRDFYDDPEFQAEMPFDLIPPDEAALKSL